MKLMAGEYEVRELLVPIFLNGECVYESPKTMDIRKYCEKELETLWDEHRRLKNPEIVPVDLSEKLENLKTQLINRFSTVD